MANVNVPDYALGSLMWVVFLEGVTKADRDWLGWQNGERREISSSGIRNWEILRKSFHEIMKNQLADPATPDSFRGPIEIAIRRCEEHIALMEQAEAALAKEITEATKPTL